MLYLQQRGFQIVARRWRSAPLRGEVDLIAWEEATLCFVEVKTRSQRNAIAAEFAVNEDKQANLRRMAARYLAHLPHVPDRVSPVMRFDVISVYLPPGRQPEIDHFRGAFH